MIVHLVMMQFKTKADAKAIKIALDSLPAQIPQIQQYEVGIDELDTQRSYHLSLYSKFENYDSMKIYQDHPAHLDVLKQIGHVAENVHTVDYTL